jgi:hypothetical protein
MSIVRTNPRAELSEFYPPPYNFLTARRVSAPTPKRPGLRGTSTTISTIAGALSGPVSFIPVAGPIIGAALEITAVIASFFKGCGSSCILTTNEVNQVEPYMQQNLAQYLAAPVSAATQAEALANFNQLWQGVVTYCSQPSMASAGKACITDRQAGSCAYKTSPGGWQQTNGVWNYVYPGANGSGSTCWNWFVSYHDPIANDPRIAEAASSPAAASSLAAGGFSLSSFLFPGLLIGGGIILASVLGDL